MTKITKEEFLIYLAARLKIKDMYGLMKNWIPMSKADDNIEKLIQSEEFTLAEKVFLSIDLGLEMSEYFEK